MIGFYMLIGFSMFLLCLFFYWLGRARAWQFWEDVIKNERLSIEARNKLAGK
ncbi:hypothetical protein [Spirosoma aerolatum]|uniref:hypothetical protein n=1 Tax=Spirosoma aerolatum TaxID=1211326 RepID=UPI0012D30F00|nr:hypothetical protein [Spirosoma aerolatum]